MPIKKRELLESLTKAALADFARGCNVPGFSTMSKPDLVDALAGLRSLRLAEVLEQLSRDELKAACAAEGLDTSGREKAVLIERLLGQGSPDDTGDTPESAKNWLKAEPPAEPKLAFKSKGGGAKPGDGDGTSAKAASPKPKDKSGPKGPKRPIEQYQHNAAERLNNPPVGLVNTDTDPIAPGAGGAAKRTYQYDPHLDPSLQWAGKAERTSFEVPTVSLHVHERIDPKTILEAVKARNGNHEEQLGLFALPTENPPLREAIDFYKHPHGWSNRLVAGDSLLVMNSLLEKEGMAGKVQMVYFDPPYGIKYGSNFQPFTGKRDVKDRNDGDLTREPEMLKAFRDTWELGIHSYLSYLRDRLLLARELLHESGSCFVQINEENVHLARTLMDEVFGIDNFASLIAFQKTTGSTARALPRTSDYLVWYARDIDQLKMRKLYQKQIPGAAGAIEYKRVELRNGDILPISEFVKGDRLSLPEGARILATDSIVSKGGDDPDIELTWQGKAIRLSCSPNRHWKPGVDGINRLWSVGRLLRQEGLRIYKRYFDDFPYRELVHVWTDTRGEDDPDYVVQTHSKVVERCLLMTTDPGDLVLDITCGSGTTAVVAEQWGRRWITCDTSRVAVTLAKQRLMQQDFDYYTLKHPEQGVAGGFDYETVPHVTLKSIANNPEIREGMSREAIDRAIAKYAEQEVLYDKPGRDNSRVRVTGPFTVEAVPAPVVIPVSDVEADAAAAAQEREADASIARQGEAARQSQWRGELLKAGARGEGGVLLTFTRVEPMGGGRLLHALGEIRDKGGFRNRTWKAGDSVAVCFGPEHAPLEQRVVELAWSEARELSPRPAVLLFAAFAFDPEAAKDIDEVDAGKAGIVPLRASMNDDLKTEDLKKKRSSNESFWLIGQPDVELARVAKGEHAGKFVVEVRGFDYFDAKTCKIESSGTDKIAMWMLDTDYDGRSVFPRQVFFPMAGEKEGWAKLAASLRAEIDQDKIEAYRGTKSLPFERGKHGRAAIKIVDDRGIESLVIRALDDVGAPAGGGAR